MEAESSGSPSLVLIEPHEVLRDGLAMLLERRGFDVRGCATSAADGEKMIAERHPDVAVVGIDLPDERGTELVRRMSDRRRESEVLAFLAGGMTGAQIARRLVLSPETVRTHVRNAMERLDARTRTEAVAKALDRGEILRS